MRQSLSFSIGVILSAVIGINTIKAMLVLDQPLTEPLPARSGSKMVTPDWLLSINQETTGRPVVRWLDNTQLLYAYPPKQNNQEWTMELVNVHTGEHKVLGEGKNPAPSPDSQWIAFTQGKKQVKQLWLMDRKGTNKKQLSHIKEGLGEYYQGSFDFAWSPDSSKIALSHQSDVPYWEKKPQLKSTIDIIELKTGRTKSITSFDAAIRNLSWFPNGEELLFMEERIGFLYNEEEDHEWIQALRIKDGSLRALVELDGLQQSLMPTPSPDGKLVAVMYDADNPMYNHMLSIGLIASDSVEGKEEPSIKRLTHELQLYSLQWSQDSQSIYVRRDYGAYRQIYVIDAKTGEPSQITNAPLNIESYALSLDGSQLAWIGQDVQATRVLRVSSSEGRNVKDLAIIQGTSKDMALSEVQEIEWKVPDYPSPMRGLLFMPLNYHEGTQYPLIVDIHGGGGGASIYLSGVSTPLEWHMWTAKGYAVFIPELRSSASFGYLAITRDDLQNHDLINCDIKDIEAGVDSLIAQGIVDPQRLAVIAHSAGARRVNWLTATTHRFKAVVSKEGWADEWIAALRDPPSTQIYQLFGGTPWEVPQNYQKNSAIFHCLGATTPTLFLMGNPDLGGADRYNTVFMLYNALKGQGVETEYVKYDDEGHNFEKPKNQKDSLARAIKWIDEHL